MTSASRLLRSQLLGYNGHQYLCNIDVSRVTVFVGDNWCEWSVDLLHAIQGYEGAVDALEGRFDDDDGNVDPTMILGLEHDLYNIIFRTISSELVDMVKEYVAVKTHRLERRGSVVYDVLKQLCRCQSEAEESLHPGENQVELSPSRDPAPMPVYPTDDWQSAEETVHDYGRRLLALYAHICRHTGVSVDESYMISNFIEGLLWDEDREEALACMKRDPDTCFEELIKEVSSAGDLWGETEYAYED